ncbi:MULTISPECIES: thioredoxin family protein [Ramlibacter]|uniref:Redoxin domain-containing protein n=1 Tax=Ramlibacter pinisoli TaxID=2682844 RepID=A0A6N8IU95_9BURK|nr:MULTISPECIES: thioredoxin family protein [Ramlibacter]MBA2965461.1 thioredoxin family protein [Ramlibacter sp. CGMCC 1.13660]MVQ30427.1 redoxin domain-containing protein [Ramlibacter pinisoli]
MLLRRTLLVASSLLLATGARAAPAVGTPAPDFELRDTSGKPVRLADFRGQHVVLEWTNPGCPYVRKHYDSGNMPATQRYATGRGVVWLSINSTERASYDWREPAQLVAWQKERQAASTALLMDEDGVAGKAYGARTTPHLYIVDPQGRLVYAGGIDSIPSSNPDDIRKATNYVRVGLDEALAGKPLTTAVSRPYGCSIKYKG